MRVQEELPTHQNLVNLLTAFWLLICSHVPQIEYYGGFDSVARRLGLDYDADCGTGDTGINQEQ